MDKNVFGVMTQIILIDEIDVMTSPPCMTLRPQLPMPACPSHPGKMNEFNVKIRIIIIWMSLMSWHLLHGPRASVTNSSLSLIRSRRHFDLAFCGPSKSQTQNLGYYELLLQCYIVVQKCCATEWWNRNLPAILLIGFLASMLSYQDSSWNCDSINFY